MCVFCLGFFNYLCFVLFFLFFLTSQEVDRFKFELFCLNICCLTQCFKCRLPIFFFLFLVGYSEMVTVCKATFRDIFIQGVCAPFVITVTEHDFPGQKIDFKA